MLSSIDSESELSEYKIVKLSQSEFEISARTLIKNIEEDLEIELCNLEEDYVTLGELIFSIAGKIPSVGEVIKYKNGVRFIVKNTSDNRYIDKVILDLSNYRN